MSTDKSGLSRVVDSLHPSLESIRNHAEQLRRLALEIPLTDGAMARIVTEINGALTDLQAAEADLSRRLSSLPENILESKRQLVEAQQVAHIGSWEWDIYTNRLTWSDELYRIFGLRPQEIEMSYGAFLERVHAEDRGHVSRLVATAFRDHKPFSYEGRIIHPQGAVRVIHVRGEVIVSEAAPVRMVGIAQDITERKQAEMERTRLFTFEQAARNEAEHISQLRNELLEREEKTRREWQATFDAMSDAVLLVDRNDWLIRANRAFYENFNLNPEECAGRPVKELLHRDKEKCMTVEECPVCEMRAKGERGAVEFQPGVISSYPVFASTAPITDDGGNVIAVVEVIRDLTDLYSAREAAERERISLDATIEQMADGFIVFDETAAIVRANKQAQRIMDIPIEQLSAVGNIWLAEGRFTDEEGQPVAMTDLPVVIALREQRVVDTAVWYTRPDGRKLLISINASPFFDNESRVVGAVALIRDVTERKRERERLQQAEKLRALGQLSSGVAHNFNNALAAVIGYAQLALPKVKDPDIEKYLRVIEQSAKDAARMVGRIQNFSRARIRKDEFMQVRLADTVRDAIEITSPRWRYDAQSLGIRYEVELRWQAEEDALVSGEPSELREVFVNIILNALDAMPQGGQVVITGTSSATSIFVSFDDTGTGMTEEVKRRVFEPFFTTKGVTGLGMGLSESYRIIERHGGRIDVESRLKQGTTFTISLPLARIEEIYSEAREAPPTVTGAQVLVIDDEEFVRNVLSAILAEQGHKVIEAASAEEGVRLVEHHKFDIVFTDLAMPVSDGIAAAREIKARAPETKVVLMTGYGSEKAYQMAGANSSIDAAISKPFRLTEICEIIESLLK